MSLIPVGIGIDRAAVLGLLGPVLFRQRFIGVFVADVTVSEQHQDELAITEHPVQQGAAITDHSYKRPARLTVRAGWTNSNRAGNPNEVQEIYAGFLAMQASRIPIAVMTGKRFYTDMLIASIQTDTDEKWENATILTVEMQQIILVQTQVLAVPPAASMYQPEINAATTDLGTRSLTLGTAFNATERGIGHA